MPRMVNIDRSAPLLLPPDLRDWIPEDDIVHFVIESVERLSLPSMRVNHRGTGSEQYPPRMMLALVIYCYVNGNFSSRRIERATYRDIAVRYVTADTHPDHDTICKFRRENLPAVAEAFVEVLRLAREMGVLKVGTVSIDGSKIKSNASKDKNVRYDRAKELDEQLRKDVQELLFKAEQADNENVDDGQKLPAEIARREALMRKLEKARAYLESRAKAAAEAERAEFERKVAARDDRDGSLKGKPPRAPSEAPDDSTQVNLTDHDSRLMRKNKSSGYEQCYNAQAAVLADSGYVNREALAALASADPPIDAYVAVGRDEASDRRRYEFRPKDAAERPEKRVTDPALLAMREKLRTDDGRRRYAKRKQTVEPCFGIIKQAMGFRQFLLRGHEKVSGEWALVTLAYNVKRLFSLTRAARSERGVAATG
jgi:transposase